nr:ATP-binding protein [Aureimonas sp. AU4]
MSDLRECRRRTPHSEQGCASLFADTQSGKSTAVKHYIETKVLDDVIAAGELKGDGLNRVKAATLQKRVLHVTLTDKATPKSLACDILDVLGAKYSAGSSTPLLMRQAYVLLKGCRTELLVVDEIQHLSLTALRQGTRASSSNQFETSATNTLKLMMIRGLVPILFVGKTEARHHLFNDEQLAARCVNEINYGRLRLEIASEYKIFKDYLGKVGLMLREHGLFPECSNFLSGDIPACVFEVAGGRLGMASRLVEAGAERSLERKGTTVNRDDLSQATDEWAIPKGHIDYNPFRDGVRRAILK